MKTVFYNEQRQLRYSFVNGVIPCRVNMFTPFIRLCSYLFFDILDNLKIQYALFAGSSIGLKRNRLNIPWVDDFDIVVLEDQLSKMDHLISALNHYGFSCRYRKNAREGVQIYYYPDCTRNIEYGGTFQCDIFFSYFDQNRLLKNKGSWGLYHKREVKMDWVLPFKKQMFEGKMLPFFGDYLADVDHEYGDVDMAVIHIEHSKYRLHLKNHWRSCYTEFNHFVEIAKLNTKNNIQYMRPNSKVDTWSLKNFKNYSFSDLLKKINIVNPKLLVIVDLRYLKYVLDIKNYLPHIKVSAMSNRIPNCWLLHLSLVDEIITDKRLFLKDDYPLISFKKVTLYPPSKYLQLLRSPAIDLQGLTMTASPLKKAPERPLLQKHISTLPCKTKNLLSMYNYMAAAR